MDNVINTAIAAVAPKTIQARISNWAISNFKGWGELDESRVFEIPCKSGLYTSLMSMISNLKGIEKVSDTSNPKVGGIVVYLKDNNGKTKTFYYSFEEYGRASDADHAICQWLQDNKISYKKGNKNY